MSFYCSLLLSISIYNIYTILFSAFKSWCVHYLMAIFCFVLFLYLVVYLHADISVPLPLPLPLPLLSSIFSSLFSFFSLYLFLNGRRYGCECGYVFSSSSPPSSPPSPPV